MKAAISAVTLALIAIPAIAQNPNRLYQLKELKVIEMSMDGKKIKAWLADTSSKRQEGMMFLKDKEVPMGHGMLFVFPNKQQLGFWMKNTYIPLDIAFLDQRGVVLNVARMKPHDETSIKSQGMAVYALEMKAGSFAQLGIRKGIHFSIPKTVKGQP